MVTLEPARDYYADLEIDPQATINDVKKQFRKLALKYHPDRNPGQEAEFNSKFQAIQAANEILTDPALRAKYDAQRLRDGPSRPPAERPARPNVPPRNRTTTEFPPPPRPPPPNSYKSSYSPPLNTAGPRRYAKPPRANGHWGHYETEEVKAKANDFKAWEQMRHGQGPIPKHRPPPQRAPRNPILDPDRTSPPRKEPETLSTKAREKWEDLLDAGKSKLGKQPARPNSRKAGHGHDSLDEDEIETRPSAYNVFKGDHPKKPEPPPLPKRDFWRGEPLPNPLREPFPQSNARMRANYPQVGNERINPIGSNLHRANTSTTARDPKSRPYRPNLDSVHFEGDHIRANSAGAANRNQPARPTGLSSTTTSETSTDNSSDDAEAGHLTGPPPTDRKRRVPKSRKPRVPAGANARPKPGFSPHVRVDEGQAPHPHYSGSRRHSGIDLPTASPPSDNSVPPNLNRMSHGPNLSEAYPTNLSAETASGHRYPQRHRSFDGRYQLPDGRNSPALPSRGGTESNNGYSPLSFLHLFGPLPSQKWSKLWPFGPPGERIPSMRVKTPFWAIPSSLPPSSNAQQRMPAHADHHMFPKISASFRSPANQPLFSSRFANENTNADRRPAPFRSQSSETISTKFSNAESPPKFGNENPFAARRPSQQGSGSTILPSESVPNGTSSTNRTENRSPTSDIPPPPKVGDKWSPEEWEKRFGVHTFEVPISNPPSGRATSRKRSGTPKASLNNLRRTGTFRTAAFQANVIDDDEEAPESRAGDDENDLLDARRTRESNVSDGSAMDIDSTPPAAHNRELEEGLSPTSTAKRVPFTPTKDNSTSSGNSEAAGFNLNGFRHVAPFSSAQEGLGGTNDLKDALPFDSRASAAKPDFAKCYETVDLPNPPKPPLPPSGLDDMSFAQYVSAMNIYMFNWNSFNTKMVLTFQRRQEEHREIGQGWIGQVGGDVGAYLKALDEDERGRVWWATACDKHKVTMQNLKSVRDAMLRAKGNA